MSQLEGLNREQLNKLDKETLIDLLLNALERISELERGIIKSCGLAKQKGWRILVGDKTYNSGKTARRIRHEQRYHSYREHSTRNKCNN